MGGGKIVAKKAKGGGRAPCHLASGVGPVPQFGRISSLARDGGGPSCQGGRGRGYVVQKEKGDRVKAVWAIVLGGLALCMAAAGSGNVRADALPDPMALTGLWQTDGKGSLVELYGCAEDG